MKLRLCIVAGNRSKTLFGLTSVRETLLKLLANYIGAYCMCSLAWRGAVREGFCTETHTYYHREAVKQKQKQIFSHKLCIFRYFGDGI